MNLKYNFNISFQFVNSTYFSVITKKIISSSNAIKWNPATSMHACYEL